MKKQYIVIILACTIFRLHGQIVADHTVVDKYTEIPQEYLDIVKSMLVCIAGESHSYAYRLGMELLEEMDGRFQVRTYDRTSPPASTEQYLRTGRHKEVGEDYFFSQTSIAEMKDDISSQHATGNPFDVMAFGWCYDMTKGDEPGGGLDPEYQVRWAGRSEGSPSGSMRWGLDSDDESLTGNKVSLDTYLAAIESYNEFCEQNSFGTKWIFTTGPVDNPDLAASENGFQREIKHDYIRDFVNDHPDRILFDYADILCWNYQGDQYTTDWNDNGSMRKHAQIHPDNMMDYDNAWNPVPHVEDNDHIGQVGAVRLAKAMWWLLARMAGWDGGGTSSNEQEEAPHSEHNDLAIFAGSDYLQVNSPANLDRGLLRLYDLQGRLCCELNIQGNMTTIPTSSYPPGTYLVLVTKDKYKDSQKVIISR